MRPCVRVALVTACFSLGACRPDVDGPASAVTDARVVAVKVEPPEAAPGAAVSAHALVASQGGTLDDAELEWALCRDPKSPAEDRTVNPACLTDAEDVGSGVDAGWTIPTDACALFGPETPPGDFRPRDADSTGGYFQPVRLRLPGGDAIALERLLCNLRNASTDVAASFAHDYRPNRNPSLLGVVATLHGSPVVLEHVPAKTRLALVLSFDADDAESFLRFDPASQALVTDREELRVSWYATAGTFAADRTGTDGPDAGTSSNTWTATGKPGRVHFWAVLRDSRGGQDFIAWDAVTP